MYIPNSMRRDQSYVEIENKYLHAKTNVKASYIHFNHSYCNRCVCHRYFPFFCGGNAMRCRIFIRINTSEKKNYLRSILSFCKLKLRIKNDFRIMNLLLQLSIIINEINMHLDTYMWHCGLLSNKLG